MDLALIGGKYTWSNNHSVPTLERLDRVLISEDWQQKFPLSNLRKIPRFMSDHNPLVYNSELTVEQKSKPFCFETLWVQHPDFKQKIKNIWNEPVTAKNVVSTWSIKMNRVKFFLKGWGQNLKGETRKYKQMLKDELMALEALEEIDYLPTPLLERKHVLQVELMKLLNDEELYWHKRVSATWLLKGDNNTSFFHRVANGRKRKNTTFSLQHEDGVIEGKITY